jgi:hypothetical protein
VNRYVIPPAVVVLLSLSLASSPLAQPAFGFTATGASVYAAHRQVGPHHFSDSARGSAGATCSYRANRLRALPLSPPTIAAYTGKRGASMQFVRWLATLQFRAKTWQKVLQIKSNYRKVGSKTVRLAALTVHLSNAISHPGSYRVVETIQAYNGTTLAFAGAVRHVVRNYHLTKPRALGHSCAELRHGANPGAPTKPRVGSVSVVSKDTQGQPTKVNVRLSWGKPASGGHASCFLLRWTLMTSLGNQDSQSDGADHTLSCVKGSSRVLSFTPDNTPSTWIRWQVAGKNSSGVGVWRAAMGIVPDMVGDQTPDAYQKLRVGSLVPNPRDLGNAPSPSEAYAVASQSPTSGTLYGGTYVSIAFYDGFK